MRVRPGLRWGGRYPSPTHPLDTCGASTLAPSALVTRRLRRIDPHTFGTRQSATPSVFDTVPAYDGQTDEQTDMPTVAIAVHA